MGSALLDGLESASPYPLRSANRRGDSIVAAFTVRTAKVCLPRWLALLPWVVAS